MIRNSDHWRNPIIQINDATIKVGWHAGKDRQWKEIQPDALEEFLLELPESAWPYGRVAIWTECGVSSGAKEARQYRQKSRRTVQGILKRLDVTENRWPSA